MGRCPTPEKYSCLQVDVERRERCWLVSMNNDEHADLLAN